MNQPTGTGLVVILLVVAVTIGAIAPRHARAMEPGATETTSPDRDAVEKPTFGPVIERLINHPGDGRTNVALDLDAGKFVVAPPEVDDLLRVRFDEVTKSTRPIEPIIHWARSSGADLTLAMTSPDVALVLYEGLISPAGSFATTEPGEVLSIASETLHRRGGYDKPIPPIRMFQRPGPPHGDDAFVFRTREGSVGLLQIVGSKEKPRSATIRYKLLVTTATELTKEPSRQLQVIRLQHLDSKDVLKTMKQLKLIDENLSVATPKPNLLVLRGKLSAINEALSLIELLDVPCPTVKVEAAAAETNKKIAVEGVLLELNQTGTISVVISLGAEDGVKSGDILTISRTGKRIGSLKVAKVERDKSSATIMAVEEVKALEVGDQVTNQTHPAGPPVPASLLGAWSVVAQESRGEPVDKFNFEGMRWTFGKETLDILPASINAAGNATRPVPKFSYSLDETQSPAHFNWIWHAGSGEQSTKIAGIYERKGNMLRVCIPQRGEPRPTGFETKGQKWTLYEFTRAD